MYEFITEKTLPEYEAFVQSHPKGNFAQSYLWGKQKPMWKWAAVAVRGADGKLKGTLGLMPRKVPGIGRSLMYGCRGPVCDLDDRETFTLLGNPLPDGGQWDMAVSRIKKYGGGPSWGMPETVHSTGTAKYLPILNRKLREDALELRALVHEGKDPSARREEMLAEVYNALRILYGQPLQDATLFMRDQGAYILFDQPQRGITPGQFAAWYDGDELVGSGVISE